MDFFPNADDALAYLGERWETFRTLYPSILDLQHRAAVAGAEAAQRGDTLQNDLAAEAIERLGALAQLHGSVVGRIEGIREALPSGFRGIIIPIAIAASVIATAGAVVFIFSRYNSEAEIVRQLEAGALTAAEAERLLAEIGRSPLIGAGGVGVGALAIAGVVVIMLWSRRSA